MAKQSPTSRTLQRLKQIGFMAHVVEKRIPFRNTTVDAYNFGDVLACRPGVGIVLIQATSGTNHAARKAKILAEPKAATWIASGGIVELWSWAKQGPRDKRKTWQLRRESITADMLTAAGDER